MATIEQRTQAMRLARVHVRSIYARDSAGCCWHVVLDDNNTNRSTIDSVAKDAREERRYGGPHADCVALADLSGILSCTQFGKLANEETG